MNTSRPGSLGGVHIWKSVTAASNTSHLTFSAQYVLISLDIGNHRSYTNRRCIIGDVLEICRVNYGERMRLGHLPGSSYNKLSF